MRLHAAKKLAVPFAQTILQTQLTKSQRLLGAGRVKKLRVRDGRYRTFDDVAGQHPGLLHERVHCLSGGRIRMDAHRVSVRQRPRRNHLLSFGAHAMGFILCFYGRSLFGVARHNRHSPSHIEALPVVQKWHSLRNRYSDVAL
jgi:hypothetical protein